MEWEQYLSVFLHHCLTSCLISYHFGSLINPLITVCVMWKHIYAFLFPKRNHFWLVFCHHSIFPYLLLILACVRATQFCCLNNKYEKVNDVVADLWSPLAVWNVQHTVWFDFQTSVTKTWNFPIDMTKQKHVFSSTKQPNII